MKLINASSKTISLVNGRTIKPKQTVNIDVKEGTDLYQQVMSLNKSGIIDFGH